MPADIQSRVTIHPSLVSLIEERLPQYKRDQGLSAIVNDLIYSALDNDNIMKRPPGRYSCSSSNSLEGLDKSVREGRETFLAPVSESFVCHDPKEHKAFLKEQKKITEKDSPSFQIWWEIYQASPNKAHNQSKAKAKTAFKEALKKEKAENLIEAAKRAVKDQASKIGQDIWCAPFPDAHRWLRDECYALWLEDITVEQPHQIISGVTIL